MPERVEAMFRLAFYTPDIIDLENSVPNDNYYSLIIALGDENNAGTFPVIDFKDCRNRLANITRAFTKELSITAFYGLVKDNKLEYLNILLGQRDWQRYIFRFDASHPVNDLIQEKLGLMAYPLDFPDGTTQNFYFVLHPQDLEPFINLFYSWVANADFNIDD